MERYGQKGERIGQALQRAEAELFVGRERGLAAWNMLLDDRDRIVSVVHVHGPAGIGKSWLLNRFAALAAERGIVWIGCDLGAVMPTREGVAAAICEAAERLPRGGELAADAEGRGLRQAVESLHAAAGVAPSGGAVLALDAAERGEALGEWLRSALLPALSRRVLVVLAGRLPPAGPWRDSPAWRELSMELPLGPLSAQESELYLVRRGVTDAVARRRAIAWAGGVPLLLSRVAGAAAADGVFPELRPLAADWLGGSGTPRLRELAWHASLLDTFDEETLAAACGGEAPDAAALAELLRLPCTLRVRGRGWQLRDLAREALQAEFRAARPDAWRAVRERCAAVCAERLLRERDPARAAMLWQELAYQLADSPLRAVLSVPGGRPAYALEPLDARNYPEVAAYLARRRTQPRGKAHEFVDYEGDAAYSLEMTADEDAVRGKLADAADWLALGLHSVKLLRGEDGRMIGLFAAIPIHRHTLDMLARRPVTRAFFRTLTAAERRALATPPESPAGWYIRMIDTADPDDARARALLIREALGCLAAGGLVACSTPHPFYRALLLSIGMEEVPGAAHDDYGPGKRADTFAADLRGSGREAHIRKLAGRRFGWPSERESALPYEFTAREREVAAELLRGLTNPEIASVLYVSEITVKKHVSSLLRKTGCGNRGMLMKLLADREAELTRA